MATSGTYLWNPDLALIVDEAYERCLVDPASLTSRHILSARRSIPFMLVSWATKGFMDFKIERRTQALTQGTQTYTLSGEIIDIIDIVLRRSGVDTPVEIMTRQEWLNIPDKDLQGRPDRYFADKQRDAIDLTLWTVPENSTDVLHYDCLIRYEDHDQAAQNADIPYYMQDAFAAGLAARLAEKYAPQLEDKLIAKAGIALREGLGASKEIGDLRIVPQSGRQRRVGRHYR
jgi:hypothetical protein